LARDTIIAHPETFDMGEWDCGTTACIGGHIARHVPALQERAWSTVDLSELLGFGRVFVGPYAHPLGVLFFNEMESDAAAAAARINEFLWQYGYPAMESEEVACIG
jgi:hypothetical protein